MLLHLSECCSHALSEHVLIAVGRKCCSRARFEHVLFELSNSLLQMLLPRALRATFVVNVAPARVSSTFYLSSQAHFYECCSRTRFEHVARPETMLRGTLSVCGVLGI